jgi:hypothetical protein
MRSMRSAPMGWRPTRPALGYVGSTSAATSRAHGTTRSTSARNFSRRVTRFLCANSALAKLICIGLFGVCVMAVQASMNWAELISISLTRLCLRPTSDTGAFTAVGAAL